MIAPYRRVGRIVKPHGTNGEVAVAIEPGFASMDLSGVAVWVVPPVDVPRPREVLAQREGTRGPLLQLQDIDDAAAAHDLTGRWLLACVEALPEPEPTAEDLVGYRVVDSARGEIGSVTGIIITGANDVLVVDGGRYGEVLIPVIDDVIVRVDPNSHVIDVRLLPGLIEEDAL